MFPVLFKEAPRDGFDQKSLLQVLQGTGLFQLQESRKLFLRRVRSLIRSYKKGTTPRLGKRRAQSVVSPDIFLVDKGKTPFVGVAAIKSYKSGIFSVPPQPPFR